MRKLVTENIETLVPYSPGKPIEETQRELGISRVIKLASNENPLGASPAAVQAIRETASRIFIYPDGNGSYLKERLAEHHGVQPQNIFLGNGTSELIEVLIRTFVGPDENIVTGDPTFAMYRLCCQAHGREEISVPLVDYRYDLMALARAINEKTKMVFIANPNNPTGTYQTRAELEAFLAAVPEDVLVVMDEAYLEYATADDYPDSMDYFGKYPRLVTLRTFSKIYGLAGVRVGYGVAQPELVDYINRLRQPFNVNALAQLAARAALEDQAHVTRSQQINQEGLAYLNERLPELGIKVVPSQANFVLADFGDVSGKDVYDGLLRQGVIIRPMGGYGLHSCARITVGTMEENRELVAALRKVLNKAA